MVHFSKGGLCGLYQKQSFKIILASLQCSDHCETGQVGWDVFIYLIHTALRCVFTESMKWGRRAGSPVNRNHILMYTLWVWIQPLYIDHFYKKKQTNWCCLYWHPGKWRAALPCLVIQATPKIWVSQNHPPQTLSWFRKCFSSYSPSPLSDVSLIAASLFQNCPCLCLLPHASHQFLGE